MLLRNSILAEHVESRIAQMEGLSREESERAVLLEMHIFHPDDETLLRRWLTKIDFEGSHPDSDGVEDLIAKARFDEQAREYFLDRAKKEVGHVGRGDVG